MKRAFFIAVTLVAIFVPRAVRGTDPFEQKLSPDQEIVQALNRLTFGARPGDADQVRRMGLAKWMEQQLHPDQIAENPLVEQRLKPLETIALPLDEVVAKYSPNQGMGMMMMTVDAPFQVLNKLPQGVRRKVMNGTAEERTAALDAMEPGERSKVLAALPETCRNIRPNIERRAKRRARRCRRRDRRRIVSAIRGWPTCLNPQDVQAVRSDDKDRVMAVLNKLDEEKRSERVGQLPPKSQAYFPVERREGRCGSHRGWQPVKTSKRPESIVRFIPTGN